MIFEKIKDIGREISGQGPEVKFKNDILDYEKKYGVNHAEAEKAIFANALDYLKQEIDMNGNIDYKSKEWRTFQAGLNEVFNKNDIDKFKRDALNPNIIRPVGVPSPTTKERIRQRKYYQEKFNGRSPDNTVIGESVRHTKVIKELITRFENSIPLRGSSDLETILSVNPEMGADLGAMALLKEELNKHEKMFGHETYYTESRENLVKDSKEALVTMAWSAPYAFLKAVVKTTFKNFSNPFGAFVGVADASMKLFSAEFGAGYKVVSGMIKTTNGLLKKTLSK